VHKFYKSKEEEIISEILSDNMNVDGRIRATYAHFGDIINTLYKATDLYKMIISKLVTK
jgi:hypothetical protein